MRWLRQKRIGLGSSKGTGRIRQQTGQRQITKSAAASAQHPAAGEGSSCRGLHILGWRIHGRCLLHAKQLTSLEPRSRRRKEADVGARDSVRLLTSAATKRRFMDRVEVMGSGDMASPEMQHIRLGSARASRAAWGASPQSCTFCIPTLRARLTPKPSARRRREHARARVLPIPCEISGPAY